MKKSFCLCLLFLVTLTYSQTVYKPPMPESIHSPNASDLGQYGDVPVSLYTGAPDISIPIYKIEECGIPLDISLHYDGSGVKMNSVPGWVGQNWSLDAGGVITRTERGRSVDEFDVYRGLNWNNIVINNGYGNYFHWGESSPPEWHWSNQGYKNAAPLLNGANWDSSANQSSIWSNSIYAQIFDSGGEGSKAWQPDLEPDIFTFNFMGHTGKFFLGQDGQWKVDSDSNLKIICNLPEDLVVPMMTPTDPATGSTAHEFPRVINRFTILDDQGNKYFFGGKNATELTFPQFFNQHETPVVSSAWYLIYIQDKFGNMVYQFDYELGPYLGHFYIDWGVKTPNDPNDSNAVVSPDNLNNCDYSAVKAPGQLILPVYLKKITAKSGMTVEFNSSVSNAMKFKIDDNPLFSVQYFYNNTLNIQPFNQYYFIQRLLDFSTLSPETGDMLSRLKWKKLDNITVKDNNAAAISTFNLNYINLPQRRLFLTGVNSNNDKSYSFEYYHEDLLPNFLSSAIDHLGYYNGHRFNYTCSAQALAFWRNYKNERNSDPEYVKYGSLKKIIYPTKGYTEFEFEPHTYSKQIDTNGNLLSLSSDGMIGGLRVKNITNNDGNGNNYVKSYLYVNSVGATRSSGNLLFTPTYLVENIHQPGGIISKEINLNPMIRFTNFTGSIIEYESVIERNDFFKTGLSAINTNGYTVYKYSNYSQYPDYAPINSSVPEYNYKFTKTDRGFERGKLTEKSVYDVSNVLKQRNTYQYQSNQNLRVNAMKMITNGLANGIDPVMAGYQIFYTDKYLIEEKEETFDGPTAVSKINKYSYKRYPESAGTIMNFGDLFKATEYEQYSSEGGQQKGILKTYSYPFDVAGTINTNMYNSRIIPSIYEKDEIVTGDPIEPNDINLLSEQKTDYTEIADGSNNIVQVPQTVSTKKVFNNYEPRFQFVRYYYEGNLQEYKSDSGVSNCIIWGYNNTKPIARIENATYSSITASLITAAQTAANTGTEATLMVKLNDIRNSLPGSMVTTYTYKLLFGVSTITDAKGYTTYYNYDNLGRLLNVKDAAGKIISESEYHFKN